MFEKEKFESLIKPHIYQVFLFTCPTNLPFSIARHPWFVVNRKDSVDRWGVAMNKQGVRWEVLFRTRESHVSWGHLHKNLFPLFQGIPMLPFSNRFFWKAKLHGVIEGGEGSLAARMADFIESSNDTYPYRDTYSLIGPNSNTYVQWVLNHFPESGLKLPWNAFGKYKAIHVEVSVRRKSS